MPPEDDDDSKDVELETSDEDSENDEGDDSEGSEEEENSNDESKDLTRVKKELDGVKKALRAARTEARNAKKEAAQAKNAAKQTTEKDETEVEQLKSTLEETNKQATSYRDIAIKMTVTAALKEAGAVISTKRLVKMMDLSDLDFNSKGEIEDLEDAIEELKEDFPDAFKSEDDDDSTTKTTKRKRVVGSVDAGTKTVQPKQKSMAEKLIEGKGIAFRG